MTSPRRKAGARDGDQKAGAGDPAVQPSQPRLEHLYEISKLFAGFENVDRTFEPALGIVAKALPLRTAVLTEAEGGRSKMVVWRSEGQSAAQRQAIKAQVEEAHGYLVGDGLTDALEIMERAGQTALPPQAATIGPLGQRFIAIPLVAPHGPPFGTLSLEGARVLDKTDLMFANAIANQLALALHRHRAWQADIAGRQEAEIMRAAAERDRAIADGLRKTSEALAADNARLYQEARQAVRAREQILAIVSHDLRNPLSTILLVISGLAKRGVAIVEERRRGLPEALGRIERAADRILRLVGDLLDFGNIETGRLALCLEQHAPSGIIDETLSGFEHAAQQANLRLTAEVQPQLPRIVCDRDRILQVFSNLVDNAVKATADGGQITLRAAARGNELLFSVTDDGAGIGGEDLEHLFERYWRGAEAQHRGNGLGLAIAHGIVAAHGGTIWVESQLGRGTTFWFTVPGAIARSPSADSRCP